MVGGVSLHRAARSGVRSACADWPRDWRLVAPMAAPHQILIVEDEPRVSEFIRDALMGIGYAVEVASGGADALDKVSRHAPDLVLLDLNLPDMPGFEVLDRLRARSFTVPVVIVSGNTDSLMAEAARALGAVDYVTKPFELQRLIQAVETVVGSPS
jgi:DNA-binding response OmpR family regulator